MSKSDPDPYPKDPSIEAASLLNLINLVRTGEATTRSAIGRRTGLGRAAVSHRIEQATELGFLDSGGHEDSSGGRVPKAFRFQFERAYIVICRVDARNISVGVTDLKGLVLSRGKKDWHHNENPAATVSALFGMIEDTLYRLKERPLWGIVVGLPCPVDFATGQPVLPPNMPSWHGVDVRRAFEERFDVPVWVDNEVNLLALGTGLSHRASADIIYLDIGLGIGAALVSDGRIHRGASGAAGEIGHTRIPGSEAVCRCGRIGCLDAVASGWAIMRDAGKALGDGAASMLLKPVKMGNLTIKDLITAAENGDSLALNLVRSSAKATGTTVAAVVNMFNPGLVLIGGEIGSASEAFLAGVRQRVYEMSTPLSTRDLAVVPSPIHEDSLFKGGAELAAEQLFRVTFQSWFNWGKPRIIGRDAARE